MFFNLDTAEKNSTFELFQCEIYIFFCFILQPQDAYGLEKLASEELCKHYTKDFGIECRVGRFHNIYGPFGTWKGTVLNFCWIQIMNFLCGSIWTLACKTLMP